MPSLKPPRFWFNPPTNPGWISTATTPLSVIWRSATRRRLRSGRRATLGVPVICVGNVSVGGSGKTPTVIEIVSRLIARGERPHVLSKGYGGTSVGPVMVDPSVHEAGHVGDEPLLHSAFAPTWVARDRLKGGQTAVAVGATAIVMDDGFQNSDLWHDLSVIVVNAKTGFGNGRVVPAGPLRETVEDALARADLVVSIGSNDEHEALVMQWPALQEVPCARGNLEVLPTGMDWEGQRVMAFAGIAHPERFYATLGELGANVAGTRSFADHQAYGPGILRRLERDAARLEAQLVTTEKDSVRLPPQYRTRVLSVPIRLVMQDPSTLDEKLGEILEPDQQGMP